MLEQVRSFNRAVTQSIGALHDHYLSSSVPLGAARVLWEIGDGCDVRELRDQRNPVAEREAAVPMAGAPPRLAAVRPVGEELRPERTDRTVPDHVVDGGDRAEERQDERTDLRQEDPRVDDVRAEVRERSAERDRGVGIRGLEDRPQASRRADAGVLGLDRLSRDARPAREQPHLDAARHEPSAQVLRLDLGAARQARVVVEEENPHARAEDRDGPAPAASHSAVRRIASRRGIPGT